MGNWIIFLLYPFLGYERFPISMLCIMTEQEGPALDWAGRGRPHDGIHTCSPHPHPHHCHPWSEDCTPWTPHTATAWSWFSEVLLLQSVSYAFVSKPPYLCGTAVSPDRMYWCGSPDTITILSSARRVLEGGGRVSPAIDGFPCLNPAQNNTSLIPLSRTRKYVFI